MAEKFFLGAMTPNGFSTQLGEVVSGKTHFTYILKGGAGTGKSSLMKKIADRFEQTEHVSRFYCSSDPDSLDAVVLHSSKTVVIDGTAPHVFDPTFPGACQKIVNLGYYWDDSMIVHNKESIILASEQNKSLMSSAASVSAALGRICSDTLRCAQEFTDKAKLEAFAQRFCKKLLGKKKGSRGKSSIRQLSALTRYGYLTFAETLENYLDLYLLRDNCFAASDMFIGLVAEQAQALGYDVKLSPCLLLDRTVREHLLIDELGVAIVSENPLTELEVRNGTVINMSRFYDKQKMLGSKKLLKTNAVLIDELSGIASRRMDQAKQVHDVIESYYIGAMDFDGLDRVCDNISTEILNK